MPAIADNPSLAFLTELGIARPAHVYHNLPIPRLVEEAVSRGEAHLAVGGPIVATTGDHTGRSPQDKYVVRDEATENVIWWGNVNHPMHPSDFQHLLGRATAFLQGRDLFVLEGSAGADPQHAVPLRVVTMHAWHAMFARTMFLPPLPGGSEAPYTVLHVPDFLTVPGYDNTRSDTCIAINVSRRIVLICGTQYAGEIKKSIFTIANFVFPRRGVMPMHCSANEGPDGDVALFFGLSGTGKTTLSADPARTLIGDDEHGWSDEGVFNIEAGCYAKVIKLSATAEPEIYSTTKRFGTVMENVVLDPVTAELDLDSAALTENTRAAYPLEFMPSSKPNRRGGHPRNIIMLTADAFGVLPPVSKLTAEQAMYHFLSGYTAKVAGTEMGVTEPTATFSACFGAPFLPLPPVAYANLLGERISHHAASVWLVNTGWTAGPYGVGHRMPIQSTRAIIRAILGGSLADAPVRTDPVFGFDVPLVCEGVPTELLDPRATWPNPIEYDRQAAKLAAMFAKNFAQFGDALSPAIRAAGPVAEPAHAGD